MNQGIIVSKSVFDQKAELCQPRLRLGWQSSAFWSQTDLETIIPLFNFIISTYPLLYNATNSYSALLNSSYTFFLWCIFIFFSSTICYLMCVFTDLLFVRTKMKTVILVMSLYSLVLLFCPWGAHNLAECIIYLLSTVISLTSLYILFLYFNQENN